MAEWIADTLRNSIEDIVSGVLAASWILIAVAIVLSGGAHNLIGE